MSAAGPGRRTRFSRPTDIKKDRGSFVKDGGSSYPRGQFGGPPAGGVRGRDHSRQSLNREQLRKISRCRLCQKKGTGQVSAQPRRMAWELTAFAYCNMDAGLSRSAFTFLTMSEVKHAIHQVAGGCVRSGGDGWAFLSLPDGEAVLDIGATRDLIGQTALADLTKVLHAAGLQPVKIDKPVNTPTGIGGSARALYAVLLPISPGGVPGVLEMTVLEGNVPPLLSVGFSDYLKASIDLAENKITFRSLDLEMSMNKISTGHRTISLVQWSGGEFPIPPEVQQKYGLPDQAFNLSSPAFCAYPKRVAAVFVRQPEEPNQGSSFLHSVFNEPNDFKKNNTPQVISFATDSAVMSPCHPVSHAVEDSHPVFHEDSHPIFHADSHPVLHAGETVDEGMSGKRQVVFSDPSHNFLLRQEQSPSRSLACAPCDNVCQRTELGCSSFQMGSSLCPHRSKAESGHGGDQCRASGAGMAASDECHRPDAGGKSPELRGSGSCGAPHQVCPGHEAVDARGPCRGKVLAFHGVSDSPGQSTCQMGSVSEVQCPDQVPVTAPRPCQEPDQKGYIDAARAGVSHASGDTSKIYGTIISSEHGRDEPFWRDAADHRDSNAELPSTGSADWLCDSASQSISGRACTRPVPDAQHDAGHSTGAADTSDSGPDADAPGELSLGRSGGDGLVGCRGGGIKPGVYVQPERDASRLQRPTWPSWMLRTGMIATSALLTWHQCSADLQDRLHGLGFEAEECYVFTYDLDVEHQECQAYKVEPGAVGHQLFTVCPGPKECAAYKVDPGAVDQPHSNECPGLKELGVSEVDPGPNLPRGSSECPGRNQLPRPAWVPHFAQQRDLRIDRTLPLDLYDDNNWCTVWRRVVAAETGDIIEDCPGPHAALDFESPLDLWVSCWGLPLDFMWLASLSTQENPPLRLDSEGRASQSGKFWAVHSDILNEESIGLWTEKLSDVSNKTEMHRCAQNLCFLAKNATNVSNRRLDFAELFSPSRVSPHAQRLGLKVDMDAVFDLTAGWDVRKKEHRQKFRSFQKERRPRTLMASPECKAFSPLQNINRDRMDPERLRVLLTEGHLMWDYSI